MEAITAQVRTRNRDPETSCPRNVVSTESRNGCRSVVQCLSLRSSSSTNNARHLLQNWWIRQYLDGENLTAMDHASTTTTALANTNTCAAGSVAILFNKKTRERAPAASHRDLRRSSSRLSLRFGVWDPRKTPGSDFQFDSALLVSGSCVHNVKNTPAKSRPCRFSVDGGLV